MIVDKTVLIIAICAFIGYSVVAVATHYLLKTFSKQFKHLNRRTKTEWVSIVPSTIHSFIAFSMGFKIFSKYGDDMYVWAEKQNFPLLDYAMANSCGYFLEDSLALLPFYKNPIDGVPMVLHHVACVMYTIMFLLNHYAPYETTFVLITELSTPFLNIRYMMKELGYSKSIWYIVNGFVLMIVYLLCRPISMSRLPYHIWVNRSQLFDLSYWSKLTILVGQLTFWGLFFLNYYWAYKIVRVFFYHVFHTEENKPKKGKKN